MSNRLPPEEYNVLCWCVHQRDKWKCRCCGKRENLHAHHILYRSQGGLDETRNLITLCFTCHDKVHTHKIRIRRYDGSVELPVNADKMVEFVIVGLGSYKA